MLKWENITVQQFQEVSKLTTDTSLDEMGKLERLICIMFDMSEREVEELPMQEFTAKAKAVAFLLNEQTIPGKAVRSIKVNGRRYAIEYNPVKLKHRQYVEIMHFGDKPIDNMHHIMASLVQPVRLGFKRKNKAEDHERISADMLNARVVDVFHTAVFFCKLYVNLMQAIKGYLKEEMMKSRKITQEEAELIITTSLRAMDGFTQPHR
jgi:hypothetical protein